MDVLTAVRRLLRLGGLEGPFDQLVGGFSAFFPLLRGRWLTSEGGVAVYSEDEPYEIGFAEHYETNLRPLVEGFERNRIAALKKARIRCFLMLPILLATLLLGAYWFSEVGDDWEAKGTIVCGVLLAVLGIFWWFSQPLKTYQTSIKSDIFPHIVSFFGDYQYAASIPDRISQYSDFGIVPVNNGESSEDQFIGVYKGVEIDLFETHLTNTTGTVKNRNTKTVFEGIVISLSLNKTFEGQTIVKKDWGRLVNRTFQSSGGLEVVRLEDPRFEKEFEVYSTDQVEARYLLTPSFMERLVDLRKAFGGEGIQCSFYQSQLLMMIPSRRNMFEPGSIFEVENFIDDAKSLLKEMNIIHQIVDTLKLDLDIGL